MATEKKRKEGLEAVCKNQLITQHDLENFKIELLEEIRLLLRTIHSGPGKKWLKSSEVRKLLDISPGKLHLLRSTRQLAYMRVGGVIYYDKDDISKMFEKSKVQVISK